MAFSHRSRVIGFLIGLALIGAAFPLPAEAQQRPAPAIELAAGQLQFPDDGVVREGFVGGAGRFYLSPRVGIGPEFSYVRGDRHSHLILTGNVTFDFVGPANGRLQPVTPYLVAGGGLYRTREQFPREVFTSNEGAFTAGGGVRVRVTDRVFALAEARVGWELHIRLNGGVGVRLGR